jgi:pimeloyl-ACP methyl ester carboxylesterase
MYVSRLAVATLSLIVMACSGGRSGPAPIDARETVNGHPLHVQCRGAPGPTVVFESGIGGDHSLWAIADRIRDRAFACLYDRPGDGDAPPPAEPRTAKSDVADLHDLLAAAGIPRPVVVVGHSYGGLVAWMEAAEHPDDVSAVVLIDPAHPDDLERTQAILSNAERQVFMAGLAVPNVDFAKSEREAATEPAAFPAIPLTVITASHSMDPWCEKRLPCASMEAVHLELSDGYARLRPDARHVVVATSHYVHSDNPGLVVDEIDRILDVVALAASTTPR